MLVQALGLFALDSLDMLPAAKVSTRRGRGGGARVSRGGNVLFELVVNSLV